MSARIASAIRISISVKPARRERCAHGRGGCPDVARDARERVVGHCGIGDRDLDLAKRRIRRAGHVLAPRRSARPPATASPSRVPSGGHGAATCAAASRFCATHSASVRCFSSVAPSAACATARIPAASATARIASATRISTSVNPRPRRCARGSADRRRSASDHAGEATTSAYGSLRPLARNGRIASGATGAPA